MVIEMRTVQYFEALEGLPDTKPGTRILVLGEQKIYELDSKGRWRRVGPKRFRKDRRKSA